VRRTSIYLTAEQRAQLDARARAQGSSRAELVRNMLDRTIHRDADRLAADLAAITDPFGALPDDASELDRSDGARGAHLEHVAGR
jgi:hypothetical protein